MLTRIVMAVLLLGLGTHAVAGPRPDPITSVFYIDSYVGITNNLLSDSFAVEVEDFATSGTTSVSAQFPAFPVIPFATGEANASFGVLGAGARAFGQAPVGVIFPGGYAAVAAGIFTDEYTITGGSGVASVSTTLSGVFGPEADALMGYILLKSTTPFTDLDALGDVLGDYILLGTPLPAGLESTLEVTASQSAPLAGPVLTGTFTYTSGVPFYLAAGLVTFAQQSGAADFLTTAQFGISAPAGGVLSTASGFTYAQAVPEPGTWATLLAGLALVGVVAARRFQA